MGEDVMLRWVYFFFFKKLAVSEKQLFASNILQVFCMWCFRERGLFSFWCWWRFLYGGEFCCTVPCFLAECWHSHHNTVLAHWESSWASYGLLLQGLVCLAPSNWNYCLITCCRAPVGALCLLILGALQDFSGTCKPQGRWGWDARWACMSSTQLSPEACRQSGLMKENAINFPLRICCSSLLCLTVA